MRIRSPFNFAHSAVALLASACFFGLAMPAQSAGSDGGQGWWPWSKASSLARSATNTTGWPAWFGRSLPNDLLADNGSAKHIVKIGNTGADDVGVSPRKAEFSTLFGDLDDAMRAIRRAAALERMATLDGSGKNARSRSDVVVFDNRADQVNSEAGQAL